MNETAGLNYDVYDQDADLNDDSSPAGMRAQLNKDPGEVAAMFNSVARRYDMMNALASGGMDHVWLRALRTAVDGEPGEEILDLAAGTGASAAAIAAGGARVTACDLSEGMIAVGRARHPEISFVQGDATNLQFEDATFDAVTMSYGLRNISDPERALREMARVTKPGGRLVICEFSHPTDPIFSRLYRIHQMVVMPTLARLVSSDDVAYDYLVETIQSWPDQITVGQMIARSGWESVEYRNLTGGIVALHRARRAQ